MKPSFYLREVTDMLSSVRECRIAEWCEHQPVIPKVIGSIPRSAQYYATGCRC